MVIKKKRRKLFISFLVSNSFQLVPDRNPPTPVTSSNSKKRSTLPKQRKYGVFFPCPVNSSNENRLFCFQIEKSS